MNQTQWPRLLLNLKVTAESLLEHHVGDIWNVYGGLNRMCSALISILCDDFKLSDDSGCPDLWQFIQGLNWLQPSNSGWASPATSSTQFPESVQRNKSMKWIYSQVENHTISESLCWLLSDREHLLHCYHEEAFLCQPKYAEATLICLKAVEQNQLSLLADVDPSLFVIPSGNSEFRKAHRRCSSFPIASKTADRRTQDIELPVLSVAEATTWGNVVTGFGVTHGSVPSTSEWPQSLGKKKEPAGIRRTRSLPIIRNNQQEEALPRLRSKTITSKISPSTLKVDYPGLRRDRTMRGRKKRERERRTTFMEDGGTSVRVAASGYFPRPSQGQSLTSYLSSGPFTSAELDRENAHFRISEAMISAIEQVKFNQQVAGLRFNSDGTVQRRPRPRRTKPVVVGRTRRAWEERVETGSEQTPSPPTSTPTPDHSDEDTGSDAEQVALSLLRQFEDQQLPRASELEWLVSAEDAPQDLLPMPGARPVNSDDAYSTPLRGTADWAPPRPQLILTPHPPPVRKALLAKQSLRCAGCGSRVAAEYSCHFRYCEYLGKYFCTACHTNQLAIIPGRVIAHWNFSRYPVSTFSYELLNQMETDPLFRIDDLNPKLFKKVKNLERTRTFRLQLNYLRDFLLTCRFAEHLKDLLSSVSPYALNEPNLFSLNDLCRVKTGELPVDLQAIVKTCLAHVATCGLCQARGFICELCPCKAAIFPWALAEVSRCSNCGACFHRNCFKPPACPRCVRLAARRHSIKDS